MDVDGSPVELCDVAGPARWWVGFTDGQGDAWYQWMTRPGFRHCFAFRALASEVILLVNPLLHRVDTRSFWMRPDVMIAQEQAAGARIVTIELQPTKADPPRRGPILTCASVCAYSMGMDTRAITPYGLYRAILAHGGREL